MSDAALVPLLKRDRLIVAAALSAIVLLAWAWLLQISAGMASMQGMPAGSDMPGMDMPAMAPAFMPWTAAHALFLFAMWAVMMVGMMTPSAAPMVLLYAGVARQAAARGTPLAAAGWFAAGYLAAWVVFAAVATAAQYGLERLALLSPAMASDSKYFGAAVLILAGLYQFLPLKNACLSHCRAPLVFIQHHGGFKPGTTASLRLGLLHGAYCIGCCWALMALLFVGGVMNLLWIAALMIFVLAEKLLPGGRYISMTGGLAALTAGGSMLLH